MTPDERVAAYVLERFRATGYSRLNDGFDTYEHVRDCTTTTARIEDQGDGRCGEGTCEMFYIDAEMHCAHGATYDFAYREGGEIADLIAHLAKLDQ